LQTHSQYNRREPKKQAQAAAGLYRDAVRQVNAIAGEVQGNFTILGKLA
jgi:hypothetical protein